MDQPGMVHLQTTLRDMALNAPRLYGLGNSTSEMPTKYYSPLSLFIQYTPTTLISQSILLMSVRVPQKLFLRMYVYTVAAYIRYAGILKKR